MLITVNGLVTRSYPSGDHDRLIHIITEDRGRLSVIVKGGGSQRGGATAACTQLFTYGNYELYSGNNGDLYWFRGGSVLTSFYRLSSDLERMSLATYLCDVACDLTEKNAAAEETSAGSSFFISPTPLWILTWAAPFPQSVYQMVPTDRFSSVMAFCAVKAKSVHLLATRDPIVTVGLLLVLYSRRPFLAILVRFSVPISMVLACWA